MQIHVRSAQFPGWVVPVLALIALALLPFAIALGLLVGVLALGAGVARVLFFPVSPQGAARPDLRDPSSKDRLADPSAIDAEFEVKESHEKEQDR